MASWPSIFDLCKPRREVLAGELPDAIFAADLWDVIAGTAHQDYRDPERFFTGTHPTENLKLLVKEVAERLAGVSGGTPIFRLETGFGGGKTHSLIAAVHVAHQGEQLATQLADYHIAQFPRPGEVRVAAFVGEESDPLSGQEQRVDGQRLRTYTPWGQLALLAGGLQGYAQVRDNDLQGVAPARGTLEAALGDQPVLILIDELVLYMARVFALREEQTRSHVHSQWATFLQTLFSIATRRPQTVVLLTLPYEQDANRKLTGELKQCIPTVLETVDELEKTAARQTRNLTPTQSYERAAVLARRRALRGTLLLHAQHVDLSRSDLRDEVLARLGWNAFAQALEADVVQPAGRTHASAVDLFRTRASVNKRFQERLSAVQPGETRETLDAWVQEIYTGFSVLQVIPCPHDHTAIPNTAERLRLVLVHYDKECGAVGGGDRLNVTKALFTRTGVNDSPRTGDLFTGGQSGPLLECYRVDFGETPDEAVRGRRNVRRSVAEGPILQCLRQHNKLVPEVSAETPCVLAPEVVRRAPLWHTGEPRLATEEVWERLRRESALPMLLKPADLLPTLRAGVSSTPEALWTSYDQGERKVYTRDNAAALSPVLAGRAEAPEPMAAEHFGPAAAPRWLRSEDGMRLALAFSAARWLATPRQRRLLREGLEKLPSEVVLYCFTLCFYGYRQAAGCAALRTLLTHEGPEDAGAERPATRRKRQRQSGSGPTLFALSTGGQA